MLRRRRRSRPANLPATSQGLQGLDRRCRRAAPSADGRAHRIWSRLRPQLRACRLENTPCCRAANAARSSSASSIPACCREPETSEPASNSAAYSPRGDAGSDQEGEGWERTKAMVPSRKAATSLYLPSNTPLNQSGTDDLEAVLSRSSSSTGLDHRVDRQHLHSGVGERVVVGEVEQLGVDHAGVHDVDPRRRCRAGRPSCTRPTPRSRPWSRRTPPRREVTGGPRPTKRTRSGRLVR